MTFNPLGPTRVRVALKGRGQHGHAPCLGSEGLTLTLKVMASITKMRSGKTLATSSTLLKYLTGSRTSRACSRSLNFPAQEERQAARVGPLAGSLMRLCGPHLLLPSPQPVSLALRWAEGQAFGSMSQLTQTSWGGEHRPPATRAQPHPMESCGWVLRSAAAFPEKPKCKVEPKYVDAELASDRTSVALGMLASSLVPAPLWLDLTTDKSLLLSGSPKSSSEDVGADDIGPYLDPAGYASALDC